jgi:DNA-binding CsgD family transcriptional regulator
MRGGATGEEQVVNHLTRSDYARAFALLNRLTECAVPGASFGRDGVRALLEVVPAEFATLSECFLASGHRRVSGLSGIALSGADIESFDRHFYSHPLVRYHGVRRGQGVRRISDELSMSEFRRTALYADHYRRIGIDRVIALPLLNDGRMLVSFVMNRTGPDFSERERERLELLQPHLAFLYRQASTLAGGDPGPDRTSSTRQEAEIRVDPPIAPATAGLTPRECEVLRWLACGKTDADIAALLGLSPRTVQKHLEHIYVKLGVETRTAAVMHAGMRPPPTH